MTLNGGDAQVNRKQRRAGEASQTDELAQIMATAQRLLEQNAIRPAENALRKALLLAPGHPDLLKELGRLHYLLGRAVSARGYIEQALAVRPNAETWLIMAQLLLAEGNLPKAIEAGDAALTLDQDNLAILLGAAEVFVTSANYDRAEITFRRILELEPGRFDALANMGSVFFSQGKFDRAARAFVAALVRQPHHAITHKNLAATQRALGNFPKALESYRTAIAMQPYLAEAHRDLGLLLLLLGSLEEGFTEYEWRWRASTIGAPLLPGLRWDGSPLGGRKILLHFEQGFGDTIQFLRYVPLVAARGARVSLCVQQPLVNLATSIDGVAEVVSAGGKLPHYDVYANLLSLPHIFRTTLREIPGQTPYLKVDTGRRAYWRGVLPGGQARRVGLVWAGNSDHENDRRRSIDKALLATLTARPDTLFYGLRPGEEVLQPMVNLGHLLTDFAETGAILENLDLLITVDTAAAHLAGALGRPVWLLLPYVPDWRWLLVRNDSPWYPTMRLFRQPAPGDWPSVIAAVDEALTQMPLPER
jgi:tetratricopeptide (TPR) repeat protein